MQLFKPDNHSTNKVKLYPIDSDEKLSMLRSFIQKHYSDLNILPQMKFHLVGDVNINSQNYKLGSYLIKLEKNDSIVPDGLLNNLINNGINTPHLFKSNQQNYLEIFNDQHVSVQSFISTNFYPGTPKTFKESLKLIIKLHHLKFTPQKNISYPSPYSTYNPKQMIQDIKKAMEQSTSDNFFNFAHRIINIIESQSSSFFSYKPPSNNKYLYHYDLHPHNLLYTDNKTLFLIDLGSFALIDPNIATSFNVFKLARKAIVKKHLTCKQVFHILKHMGINPIEIYFYGKIEIIRRLLLIMYAHYINKDYRWDSDLKKHYYALYEIKKITKDQL